MKRCPKCDRRFPDDYQKFCTFDASRLIPEVIEPSASKEHTTKEAIRSEDDEASSNLYHVFELATNRGPREETRDPYHLVGSEVRINQTRVTYNAGVERLRLMKYIGGGGMGAVYFTWSPVKGEIAVKILKPDIAEKYPDLKKLFSREVIAASPLEHPNIVRFIGHGRMTEGYPFVAVEWLRGETLDKFVARSPLNVNGALRVFEQIAQGVAHAHDRKIIHLDLKPENIFILNQKIKSDHPIVKIIDFGLSRVLTTYSGTTATRFAGTPQYCSPEHFGNGGKLSVRSDIFSLGLILYYLVAGVLPIGGSGIMAKQFGQSLPVLPTFKGLDNPEAGERIHEVIQKCTEFAPENRFQSVAELLAALIPINY